MRRRCAGKCRSSSSKLNPSSCMVACGMHVCAVAPGNTLGRLRHTAFARATIAKAHFRGVYQRLQQWLWLIGSLSGHVASDPWYSVRAVPSFQADDVAENMCATASLTGQRGISTSTGFENGTDSTYSVTTQPGRSCLRRTASKLA